ncbi:MAG: hydantoinase/oxoprolinase family protein [Candidatus Aminicenantia bacterium]
MWRIGVDTGGTFTDFVISDGNSILIKKIPSTPENPANAVLEGLKGYIKFSPIIVHGTTVATNAFLENKVARAAFIVTEGFEHILHIGRQNRLNLFSLKPEKPVSIIPISLTFGVKERTLFSGNVEKAVEKIELIRIGEALKRKKVPCVAILFLHSYVNHENERIAKEIFREKGFYVTASHEILPEYREYERGVITALNASLIPVMKDYISKLTNRIKESRLFIMQSHGGFISPEIAKEKPVYTLLSGPAGGAIAAQHFGKLTGYKKLITLDMGGTSTDVSLIDGDFKITKESFISGLPLRIPMIDIQTVGAGGGSIARIDEGGALKVGPQSVGANPGPACYGISDLPAVTDAFVVLGWIVPELFLGGDMKIYPERSFRAIERIASKSGMDIYKLAEGIIKVGVANMEKALRVVSIERGYDPRDFSLFSFGGAGGLCSVILAERLGIKNVIVPNFQGVFSALGMILSDSVKEFSFGIMKELEEIKIDEIESRFIEIEREALKLFQLEDIEEGRIIFARFLDMRYKGQSYEISIPYRENFIDDFHNTHQKLYAHSYIDKKIEIINIRLRAIGEIDKVTPPCCEEISSSAEEAFYEKRKIYYRNEFLKAKIYLRDRLHPGNIFKGPAIVTSYDGTTFIPPGYMCKIDKYYNLFIKHEDV